MQSLFNSKKAKALIYLVLGIFMAFALVGCGGAGDDLGSSDIDNGQGTSEPAPSFEADRNIHVVSREDGSGTRGAFVELMGILEKGADGSSRDHTTVEANIAGRTDVMLTYIAGDKYAIGYVSLGSLNNSIKALDIDGVPASVENIKNGSYKVARPFNIATKGEPDELSADFIGFILSKEGQAVVAEGYIAVDDTTPAYNGSKPAGKIVVAGSSSVTPVMEKLKEAYVELNPDAQIEIQQSDSTAGMTAAIDGTCQIGMASRDLKDSEKEQLNGMEIALDGIAVIVHPENPVNNLSSEDVKNIFTGAATTWQGFAE